MMPPRSRIVTPARTAGGSPGRSRDGVHRQTL